MKQRSMLLFGLLLLISATTANPTFGGNLHEDDDEESNVNHVHHNGPKFTCEYFVPNNCTSGPCTVKECPRNSAKKACMTLWGTDERTNEPIIKMKDCMEIDKEHCEIETCVDHNMEKRSSNLNFCCCRTPMCNQEFKWDPRAVSESPTEETEIEAEPEPDNMVKIVLAGFLIFGFVALLIGSQRCYKNRKQVFNELPTMEPEMSVSSQCLVIRPIDLLEIKAHGRFGTVWKGKMKSEDVAVKVFPSQDKQSWITEQEIYKLPRMNHMNILHFIGAEKHVFQDTKTEFWLITQYHPYGSLCDYLKSHTINWSETVKIAETMARGLAHLHEEIIGTRADDLKPAIAHRDFKSKNVLLKSDLTACIADFGLALRFNPGQPVGDVHGQVGTRRYMAPEVLEGAINFNRDSFLRIDVYACGLVLWELVSRSTAHGGPVAEYQLPFEAELGSHPTVEEMQESIAAKKIRPRIYDEWRSHNGLSSICDTIEECWDHDQEARLSSSCIMERLSQHTRYQNTTIDTTTTNNFISINNANDQ